MFSWAEVLREGRHKALPLQEDDKVARGWQASLLVEWCPFLAGAGFVRWGGVGLAMEFLRFKGGK